MNRSVAVLAFTLVALAPRSAAADVTVTWKTQFDGVGPRGMGARNGQAVLIVAGDKGRRENKSDAPAGARAGKPGGKDRNAALITRLDQGKIIRIDYEAGTWWERTFDDMKQHREEMAAAMTEGGGEETPAREPKMKWSKPQIEVKRPGDHQTIAGFDAESTVVTATMQGENIAGGQTCTARITAEVWSTPRTGPLEEVAGFHKRQAEALGADPENLEMLGSLWSRLGSSAKEGVSEVTDRMDAVPGYPVRTHLTVEKEGDCGLAQGAAGRRAAARSAGAGMQKVLGIGREVTSVTKQNAPADAFDVPSGLTKVDPPQRGAKARS